MTLHFGTTKIMARSFHAHIEVEASSMKLLLLEIVLE